MSGRPDDFDPRDDFEEDGDEDCGLNFDVGQCSLAGTEHCDFECPWRNSDCFAGWLQTHHPKGQAPMSDTERREGVYYNEFDPYAAQWLRNLIAAGHLPSGEVDERSIVDVQPSDLEGFVQCHFFAGIGGWPYALRLAGWPDDREVWSGSCPCQSLSSAGQRKGHADERHLWPAFFRLIDQRRPSTVFGEQVASADGIEWLAGVRADCESARYAVGAAHLCSAWAGAPDLRHRLYWVADAEGIGRTVRHAANERPADREVDAPSDAGGCDAEVLGHTKGPGLQGQRSEYRPGGERHRGLVGFAVQVDIPQWNGPTIAVECSDGWRRVSAQPDAFPLAHGVPARMGKLRGAGNAINTKVAAQFVSTFMEAT